ncbi:MAG: hypothetical protein QGD89_08530 [Actinomycetota bacterium]|nr:hypothetical protein [Actinomycetota bacterium]
MKYLRWDELKHRTPPGNLTPEQWSIASKLARGQSRKALPFVDTGGVPLSYVLTDAAPCKDIIGGGLTNRLGNHAE